MVSDRPDAGKSETKKKTSTMLPSSTQNHHQGHQSLTLAQLKVENQRLRQQAQIYKDAVVFAGHEWRNQLSILTSNTARFANGFTDVLDLEQKKTLEQIKQSTAALSRVARNFLNLAQLENYSFKLHPTLVNPLEDVINPICSTYEAFFVERGQTCHITANNPDLLVWADRDLLLSVYDNLFNNAIKYGESGGRIIVNVLERGDVDELSVWNSGPGLPEACSFNSLEPFTHSADQPVNGVGLYLARRIVQAHGGSVTLRSKAGEGLNVVITLPKRGTAKALRSR